jgi:hypothetical protein
MTTAYKMSDQSMGFLPAYQRNKHKNTGIEQGRGKNDILLKCTRCWWDSNPHSLITLLLKTLHIQMR